MPSGYLWAMAFTCRQIDAPAHDVFSVLADPHTYPEWLVGAQEVHDVDHHWPSPGARFHHSVGQRPFVLRDITEVRAVEPDRHLALSVRARPFIAAEVDFRLVGDGDRCVVCMEEEPSLRLVGNLVRPLMDPTIHHRNHRSLRRLDEFVRTRRVPV